MASLVATSFKTVSSVLLVMAGVAACLYGPCDARAQTTVRVMSYSDANEGEVLHDLLARFETHNPDIDVVLEEVPYRAILQDLPRELGEGRGPDIVRTTNLSGLSAHWLDLRPLLRDPASWDRNFGFFAGWMRPRGSTALPGFMTQLTVSGPFINRTLFQRARVPVPPPNASWERWTEAVNRVARATGTPIALAIDRSGHRIAGLAISDGAHYFTATGRPNVVDRGFERTVRRLVQWHVDGTMSRDLWTSVTGTAYRDAMPEFLAGRVVMYLSGSWQIGQLARMQEDGFEWWAVPNPCGLDSCSGMLGGAGLVAVRYTQSPEAVARVMEYLASPPILREYYERTLSIPAHAEIAAEPLDFKSLDRRVVRALQTFAAQVGTLHPTAIELNGHPLSRLIFNVTVNRVGQAVAGDIPLETALDLIDADVNGALAASGE